MESWTPPRGVMVALQELRPRTTTRLRVPLATVNSHISGDSHFSGITGRQRLKQQQESIKVPKVTSRLRSKAVCRPGLLRVENTVSEW